VQEESRFRIKVRARLTEMQREGLPIWFVKIQQTSIRGTPDFLLCVKGRFVALELKRDARSRVTRLQEFSLRKIKLAGGLSGVVAPEAWDEWEERLRKIAKGEQDE